MWTPFKITFDIIKFPLGFLFTSAMRWLLRFHKLMLAQWLLVLSYTREALTIRPTPSDTSYLHWLCGLRLLNGCTIIFIRSANRNPDYIAYSPSHLFLTSCFPRVYRGPLLLYCLKAICLIIFQKSKTYPPYVLLILLNNDRVFFLFPPFSLSLPSFSVFMFSS